MAVTKQTYTLASGWTPTTLLDDMMKPAFINAGLMTDWHDTFNISTTQWRVIKLTYNAAKTYGSTYFYIGCNTSEIGILMASGWDDATNVPTGSQFIDYHVTPTNAGNFNISWRGTNLHAASTSISSSTAISFHRYTSQVNNKQSWFVLQQGLSVSRPWGFVHPNSTLHPWLDLDKGIVNSLFWVEAEVSNAAGRVTFRLVENIRRALLTGRVLRGDTDASTAGGKYHAIDLCPFGYVGYGTISNSTNNNSYSTQPMFPLPTASSVANPAYSTDYSPICTGMMWNAYSSEGLASDFGIYMHYPNNTLTFQDKFIVTAGSEEWEILRFANNSTVTDGVSPTFIARVV